MHYDEQEIRNDSGWVGIKLRLLSVNAKSLVSLVSGLFTVANPNLSKSVEIGRTELSALASACGLDNFKKY